MTVPWLGSVAATYQNDILSTHERPIPGEPSQRCFSATDCKGEAHAGHRTGARLFGRPEVSVGIDVDETDRSLRGFPCTQEGSQHDAAIAAQHDCKTAVAGCFLHPPAERPAVGADFGFVPCSARWTYVVSIRGWDDIAQVAGTQALHQTKLAENSRGTI
jgi:hypothetical protein